MPLHTDQPRQRIVLRIRHDPLELALCRCAEKDGYRRATEFTFLVRKSLEKAELQNYQVSDKAWCCFLDRDRLNGPTASPQISLYFTRSEMQKIDSLALAAENGGARLTRAQMITSLLVDALCECEEL